MYRSSALRPVSPVKWTWLSIRPGSTVLPRASMVRTPGSAGTGTRAAGPTAAMRSPRMTTVAFSTGGAPVPSISRPPVTTVVVSRARYTSFSCRSCAACDHDRPSGADGFFFERYASW